MSSEAGIQEKQASKKHQDTDTRCHCCRYWRCRSYDRSIIITRGHGYDTTTKHHGYCTNTKHHCCCYCSCCRHTSIIHRGVTGSQAARQPDRTTDRQTGDRPTDKMDRQATPGKANTRQETKRTLQSLPTVLRNLSEDTSRLTCAPQDCMSVSVRSSPRSTTWGLPDLKHLRMRLITSYTLTEKRPVAKSRDKKRRQRVDISGGKKWWQKKRWSKVAAKSGGRSDDISDAESGGKKRWQTRRYQSGGECGDIKAVAKVVAKRGG